MPRSRSRRQARPAGPPAGWAVLAVTAAGRLLPAGGARDRYRQEFLAELYGMPRRRQAQHAVGVLSRSWALRAAVAEQAGALQGQVRVAVPRKPVLCVLNLHHVWRTRSTEDGGRYQQCLRCGKDRTPRGRGPGDWATGVGGGVGGGGV